MILGLDDELLVGTRITRWASVGYLAVGLMACSSAPQPVATAPKAKVATPPAPTATAVKEEPVRPELPAPTIVSDVGLLTPESILYDPDQDVYFVANINGKSTEADLNGFISKVSPDGQVLDLKFVDGSKKGSWLNAPKGMAIHGDILYVADLTFVRMFDRKTGESKDKIGVPKSKFLNSVSVAPNGTLYVSDTGWQAGPEGLENSGHDAIFVVEPNHWIAKDLIRDKRLTNPNGIVADNEGIWVASAGGTLYRVSAKGELSQIQDLPEKGLDGLVALPDGSMLTSSWAGRAVYHGKPGHKFEPVISEIESPAAIGFDSRRGRVLIPVFQKDQLQFHTIDATQPFASGAAPAAGQIPPAAPVPVTPPAPSQEVAPSASPAAPTSALTVKSAADGVTPDHPAPSAAHSAGPQGN